MLVRFKEATPPLMQFQLNNILRVMTNLLNYTHFHIMEWEADVDPYTWDGTRKSLSPGTELHPVDSYYEPVKHYVSWQGIVVAHPVNPEVCEWLPNWYDEPKIIFTCIGDKVERTAPWL